MLVDSGHPWHSHVPGGNIETGDHWIIARDGLLSTCAFTHHAIHRLLALPARTYQGRDVGRLLGADNRPRDDSTAPSDHVSSTDTPTPHIAAATVRALVDPDPAFIH